MRVTLTVDGLGLRVEGYKYLWAMYVAGFDSTTHCLKCLLGKRSKVVGLKMPVGETIELDVPLAGTADFVYVCGVTHGFVWERNLHLVARLTPGLDSVHSVEGVSGQRFTLRGEIAPVAIPDDVPARFRHLPAKFTTCRNFRFAAAHYTDRDSAGW